MAAAAPAPFTRRDQAPPASGGGGGLAILAAGAVAIGAGGYFLFRGHGASGGGKCGNCACETSTPAACYSAGIHGTLQASSDGTAITLMVVGAAAGSQFGFERSHCVNGVWIRDGCISGPDHPDLGCATLQSSPTFVDRNVTPGDFYEYIAWTQPPSGPGCGGNLVTLQA